ncbi:MAG: sensor domain-containing diguanylate cyclase, partial [Oceanospirillales bacterium]|nr:sensor domain-containing diguanylate cyclase [Oceanospirillales bacterium]
MKQKLLRAGLSAAPVYSLIGVMLIVCLGLTEYVAGLVQQRAEQILQMEATVVLARMRARMESEINSVLYLSRSLTTFVAVQPQSTPERWRELSREIVGEAPLVRNIGLAPDNVIRFVYPLQGNEAAIGLDYRTNAQQWPAVEEAMSSGKMKLAGPVPLIQGGHGLIARTPIYYQDDAVRRYWGLASIVVDYDRLLGQADVHEVLGGFNIAIRGADGEGEQGDLFFGEEVVFEQALAKMSVYFPSGSWVMAASLT